MSNNSFRFSQKIVGQERKAIATVIAEALEGQVRYAGAPEFCMRLKTKNLLAVGRLTGTVWFTHRKSVSMK